MCEQMAKNRGGISEGISEKEKKVAEDIKQVIGLPEILH